MENVVQLPTPMDLLAAQIRRDLDQCKRGHDEWIEGAFNLCVDLAEARRRHRADIAFGKWCSENGFGEDVINPHTRSAAIAMGKQPDALRKCLDKTERNSLHTIYDKEFNRYANVCKPLLTEKSRRKKGAMPKTDKVREVVRPILADGIPIDRGAIAEQLNVSAQAVKAAIYHEEGRLEGLNEQLDPVFIDSLKPKDKKRFDAAVQHEVERRILEERATLHERYTNYLNGVKEREAWANGIISRHKGLISREMFRKIKACLHPDHNTFVFAAEALVAFSGLEKILIKPEPEATKSPLTTVTVADLLAMKLARKQKRKS